MEGLFITAGIVLVFVLIFPLSSVASMGSAGFLLVYAAVAIGHMRIRGQTGASAWPIVVSALTCLSLFVVLLRHMIETAPTSAIALGVTLGGQLRVRGRVSPQEWANVRGGAHANRPRHSRRLSRLERDWAGPLSFDRGASGKDLR